MAKQTLFRVVSIDTDDNHVEWSSFFSNKTLAVDYCIQAFHNYVCKNLECNAIFRVYYGRKIVLELKSYLYSIKDVKTF